MSFVAGSTDCSWQFERRYRVVDACTNETTAITITHSGGDTEVPVIATVPGSLDQTIDITTQNACSDGALDWTCYFASSAITPLTVEVVKGGVLLGNFPGPALSDVSDNCTVFNVTCLLQSPTTGACQSTREVHWFGVDECGNTCLLYTSPSPRDRTRSRMPSSA